MSINKSSLIPVATVTVCLDPDHKKCHGSYVDFTQTFAVRCTCKCHSQIKKINKNGEPSKVNDRSMTVTGHVSSTKKYQDYRMDIERSS